MLLELLIAGAILVGLAILYRMHGGMPPKLPWKFDEIFIGCLISCATFFIILDTASGTLISPTPERVLWSIGISGLVAAILKTKGHGQFMTLKFLPPWPRLIKPEDWDFFVRPFFGTDPRTVEGWTELHSFEKVQRLEAYGLRKLYFRCLFGLFISGATVSIGLTGVLIYFGMYLQAAFAFFGFGLSKSLWYAFGWHFNFKVNSELDEPTEWGELGAGVGAGIVLAILMLTN